MHPVDLEPLHWSSAGLVLERTSFAMFELLNEKGLKMNLADSTRRRDLDLIAWKLDRLVKDLFGKKKKRRQKILLMKINLEETFEHFAY